MARQTKARYAILGILSMGPASGYDIKITMRQITNHFWFENDSSIYPILKQLLDEGLVKCKETNKKKLKTKKIYTITASGQKELQEWLEIEPEEQIAKNEFLLKVFFGWHVDYDITLAFIERKERELKTKLKQYHADAKEFSNKKLSPSETFRYLPLKLGIANAEAALEWCNEAITTIKKLT